MNPPEGFEQFNSVRAGRVDMLARFHMTGQGATILYLSSEVVRRFNLWETYKSCDLFYREETDEIALKLRKDTAGQRRLTRFNRYRNAFSIRIAMGAFIRQMGIRFRVNTPYSVSGMDDMIFVDLGSRKFERVHEVC